MEEGIYAFNLVADFGCSHPDRHFDWAVQSLLDSRMRSDKEML